jgi:hypothetical protein
VCRSLYETDRIWVMRDHESPATRGVFARLRITAPMSGPPRIVPDADNAIPEPTLHSDGMVELVVEPGAPAGNTAEEPAWRTSVLQAGPHIKMLPGNMRDPGDSRNFTGAVSYPAARLLVRLWLWLRPGRRGRGRCSGWTAVGVMLGRIGEA